MISSWNGLLLGKEQKNSLQEYKYMLKDCFKLRQSLCFMGKSRGIPTKKYT